MKQFRRQTSARLRVDLTAIQQNYECLARHARHAECGAVVKADAYGIGMSEVTAALADKVETFFVAQPEEGKVLRDLHPTKRIFVLHGFLPGEPHIMAQYRLIPVLNSVEQVEEWRAFCQQKHQEFPAALQIDTGMSRFGISDEDLAHPAVKAFKPVLVMSHLACADEPEHPANKFQLDNFIKMSASFPGVPRSLAASSGIFLGEAFHFDLVRPGVALYGLSPNRNENPLNHVVTVEAQILQVRNVRAGESIGYGLTYCAKAPMRVATVGIGYADGVFRSFAHRGALWWEDVRLPILGRISMDSLSVDVTDLPPDVAREGAWLSVIGVQQGLGEVAEASGTIGYEILTSLGPRFSRYYQER